MNATQPDTSHIKALRAFNRFYTQRIGVLSPYLGSEFSLTEVRVLYELAHQPHPAVAPLTASALAHILGLDMGYLSRILRRFETRKWVRRERSNTDARQSWLTLTEAGHQVFKPLQQQSREEAARMLSTASPEHRGQLIAAMQTIERVLTPNTFTPGARDSPPVITLREPRAGDMGWVIAQHGEIYAREYGWNTEFEALVADIVAGYLRKFQPEWERCWIAEVNGQRAGSVFLVRKSKTVAQLRLLILMPEARGLGLGARLTDECLAFARGKGYKKMMLWTNSGLTAARAIYAKRGFVQVKSEPYQGFGQQLVGETWELVL